MAQLRPSLFFLFLLFSHKSFIMVKNCIQPYCVLVRWKLVVKNSQHLSLPYRYTWMCKDTEVSGILIKKLSLPKDKGEGFIQDNSLKKMNRSAVSVMNISNRIYRVLKNKCCLIRDYICCLRGITNELF